MTNACRILFVDDAIITRRLFVIYKHIYRSASGMLEEQRACSFINETIRMLKRADSEDVKVTANVIKVLYLVLVDMAMHRHNQAHDKVRDLYYQIESRYIRE